jgi:hypothetical protein
VAATGEEDGDWPLTRRTTVAAGEENSGGPQLNLHRETKRKGNKV